MTAGRATLKLPSAAAVVFAVVVPATDTVIVPVPTTARAAAVMVTLPLVRLPMVTSAGDATGAPKIPSVVSEVPVAMYAIPPRTRRSFGAAVRVVELPAVGARRLVALIGVRELPPAT